MTEADGGTLNVSIGEDLIPGSFFPSITRHKTRMTILGGMSHCNTFLTQDKAFEDCKKSCLMIPDMVSSMICGVARFSSVKRLHPDT